MIQVLSVDLDPTLLAVDVDRQLLVDPRRRHRVCVGPVRDVIRSGCRGDQVV